MRANFYFLTIFLLIFSIVSNAQTKDDKFGVDKQKTLYHNSIYVEHVKQKNYEEALPSWRYMFKNAPKYNRTLYKNGVKLMRYLIAKKNDLKYVDSLMLVYDMRIKYFGNHKTYDKGWILSKKAEDLFKYKKKDVNALKEVVTIAEEAIKLKKEKVSPTIFSTSMLAVYELYKKSAVNKEKIINSYQEYVAALEKIEKTTTNAKIKKIANKVAKKVEKIFFKAGVADCNTLVEVFTPKYKANSSDVELIKKIIKLFKSADECTDLPFYIELSEKLYSLEPSSESAANMAKMFSRQGDNVKTIQYYNQAIKLETNNITKAEYKLKIASMMLKDKKLRETKKIALEALKLNPKLGMAYILIGRAYAQYSPKYSKKNFERRTLYWAAVDKFIKAKAVDSSVARDANIYIKTYKQQFPLSEDAFMEGYTKGKVYKIGSWINESTVVRFNK